MIVEHLEKEKLSVCVYVYFHEDDKSQPTLESLYANVLEQLIRRLNPGENVSEPLQRFYKQHEFRRTSPSPEEYLEILAIETRELPTVYLIVDGLDSHYNTRNPQIRHVFIKGARHLKNWNLLVTSRLGTFTKGRIESDYELVIKANANDIKLFVEMRIDEDTEMAHLTEQGVTIDHRFKKRILDTIVRKSQGVFLLAKMHMDCLASQKLLGDFKMMLGKLPESKEKTFDAALQRIQTQDDFGQKVALHCLTWLGFSMQPVTVEEVSHAFAVKEYPDSLNMEYLPSEDQLIASCAGVAVVESQTRLLRSAHDAVMDHVRRSGILPGNPHQDMALQCVAYLSFKELSNIDSSEADAAEKKQKYPLLEYAAENWFNHYHKAERSENLQSHVINFLQNSACVSVSFQIQEPTMTKGASGLHACAYLGAYDLAKKLLECGLSLDSATDDQQRPLHWAVQFGRLEVVRLFLKHKAPLDVQDNQGNTAMHVAVRLEQGGDEMVRLLIDAGSRVDLWNSQGFTPLRWCLKYALEEQATPLIQCKAELDTEDANGWTPLRWAAFYTCHQGFATIKLMVENGHNINHSGSKDGWTILRHAAQYGKESLTAFLLKTNVEVDLRDQEQGLTALRWAILHGHTSIAKLLLDSGADVNATCKDKLTPWIQAARNGNEQAVWLLLRHKPIINYQDKDGNTALHYAAKRRHKSLVWLLVEEGASLDVQDDKGRTALHKVVMHGDLSIAWYLIEKGANVDIADTEGRKPVHLAARQGLDRIVELLWEHGARLDDQDNHAFTPLHHAAIERHGSTVTYLIGKAVEPNSVDQANKTALHHVAFLGLDTIVQALLDGGAQAALQDSEGLTALHHAVRSEDTHEGHFTTILKLVKTGPCLDLQDKKGQTPLMYAAQRGNKIAAFCLRNSGADTIIQDARNWTARDHAANGQHTDLVYFL
ncbi:hypothetical protein Daus18300_008188 [Diaporthe australafricana]|uniref:Nephrocystin 3-like N-terminal domain-containing protein n=1 Tax=Diaporthe australafricana TaxID=127596 RepID=A0ABR3WJ71_9PEZI